MKHASPSSLAKLAQEVELQGNRGALIHRRGFGGACYTIFISRSSQHPILMMKAPTLC